MKLVIAASAALLTLGASGTGITVAHADPTPIPGVPTCIVLDPTPSTGPSVLPPIGFCQYCVDGGVTQEPPPVDSVGACVDSPLGRLVPVI